MSTAKGLLVWALAVLCTGLAASEETGAAVSAGSPASQEIVTTVTAVSAGHILVVDGPDKPELYVVHGVQCPVTTTAKGKAAQRFTAERVLNKKLTMNVVERKWGLTLVSVRLPDGADLAESLLREGHGTWDRAVAPDNDRFKALDHTVRESGYGFRVAPAGPGAAEPPLKETYIASDGHKIEVERSIDANGVPQVAARGNRQKNWGFEGRVELQRRAQTAAIVAQRHRAAAAAREEQLYYEDLDALGYFDDFGYGYEPFEYFDDFGYY